MAAPPEAGLSSDDFPSGPGSVEKRIRIRYETLSPAERKLADLILNFPGELASYSATELAELAQVSKAAASRLFQRLGYTSYEQARREARAAQRWGSPLYLNSSIETPGDPQAALTGHHQCEMANLSRTLDALGALDVDGMVNALSGARRVVLFGVRNSYMLASYARWQLIQMRDDVALLPNAGETLAEHVAGLTRDDLLVVVGFRRRVAAVRQIMESAHAGGVPILYLTDPTANRTAALATWVVRCQVRGASLFDSYASAMSVLHYLSSAVARRLGPQGRKRLKRIERLHDTLEEFA